MGASVYEQPATDTRGERPGGGGRVFRIVVGTILVLAALKLAEPVLVPLAGGLFLAVLARPLQRRIARAMPRRLRWLGLVAAMLVVIGVVGAFAAALGLSGRAVARELRERRSSLEQALAQTRTVAERVGIPATAIPSLPRGGGGGASGDTTAADGTAGARETPSSGGGASSGGGSSGGGALGGARRAASTLVTGLGELLLALAFCALGLAEAEAARGRLARAVPPDLDPPVLETVDEATRAFRRYAWVKTLTSAITGLATWLAALAFGLPLAWVWGLLAFLLEYVPSVGSVLAVIPPTLMALAVDGPSRALLVFLGIGTLQVILGNVVDPRLEGRYMAVSPFGVLLSIVLWGWLWGPVGALLAVPMTVAVVIAARHIPGARGLATLVSDEGETEESDGDPDERGVEMARR